MTRLLCLPCTYVGIGMLAGVVLLLLAGCAIPHEPLELTPRGEMGKELGLFSGEDGEFVIYRR